MHSRSSRKSWVSLLNQWMLVHQLNHIVWNNFRELTERNCPTITVSLSNPPEVPLHCFGVFKWYFRPLSVTWYGLNPDSCHTNVLSGVLQLQLKNFIRIYNRSALFSYWCLQRSLQGCGSGSEVNGGRVHPVGVKHFSMGQRYQIA